MPAKPPPPYPRAGDAAGGADSPRPGSRAAPPAELFVVPHERAEVEAIVSDALAIYWNMRRCGESWDSVTAPATFLAETQSPDGGTTELMEGFVADSRRHFKQLIFDLTGNIVREVYQYENDTSPPPWQKASQKRQRFYKGGVPPSTMEALLPVVQGAITDHLGLNGSGGKHRGKATNKWNVRKKKDQVDAVLVEELQEEECTWVNYDRDELSVKMHLTDTIFDSLLLDTADCVTRAINKKRRHLQTS